jgi:hypothetical protein
MTILNWNISEEYLEKFNVHKKLNNQDEMNILNFDAEEIFEQAMMQI